MWHINIKAHTHSNIALWLPTACPQCLTNKRPTLLWPWRCSGKSNAPVSSTCVRIWQFIVCFLYSLLSRFTLLTILIMSYSALCGRNILSSYGSNANSMTHTNVIFLSLVIGELRRIDIGDVEHFCINPLTCKLVIAIKKILFS